MKTETRKYLLHQVSLVLVECQRLVSKLSVIDVSDDNQDVNASISISTSVSHVSHVKKAPPEPDDNDQFWWDNYVSQLSQFSSEFYSLVYVDQQEDLQQAHDDGEVREQLRQHRRSECLLSPLLDPGDGLGLQSDDCRSTKPVQLVDNPTRMSYQQSQQQLQVTFTVTSGRKRKLIVLSIQSSAKFGEIH